jgi:hypothetical protein
MDTYNEKGKIIVISYILYMRERQLTKPLWEGNPYFFLATRVCLTSFKKILRKIVVKNMQYYLSPLHTSYR